jgi:hypothetical protein
MNESKEVETMKNKLLLTLVGALVTGALTLSGNAIAQGNGGGGGGGKGGGGVPEPPDYGDLIILYRDAGGVPIVDAAMCQQPIAFPENVGCPDEGLIWNDIDDVWLVPTDPATCAIDPLYATCVEEADFGRVNLSRASDRVLASQLQDVLVNLAIADCTSLDPAGRMVHSRYIGDELVTHAIDSPLQNLSVYKYLMLDGEIGVPLPQGAGVLETAARGFGVAMDKAGQVNIDLLVYLNQILGLTDPAVDTYLYKVSKDIKMEVMGNMEIVTKWFLDYTRLADGTATGYFYDRQTNFAGPLPAGLPLPPYLPTNAPEVGMFEFLQDLGGGSYQAGVGPTMTAVFLDDPGHSGGNIGGFAEAADDTREVIHFMHNYAVPDADKTPVPCTPLPDPTDEYDLSISPKSGLKVPKQVVATTEGREFVVNVANAGPDTAAGTLTVTANAAEGGDVLVGGLPGPFVFDFADLLPGMTYSTGTIYFTIGEPHVATKITWTAVVEPEQEDPYMGNNAVTAVSNVRVTGGGGGH